jgi:DNA polymerase II small subunit
MDISLQKKELVKIFMQKGILISPDFVEKLKTVSDDKINSLIQTFSNFKEGPVVISKEIENFLSTFSDKEPDWKEFERILTSIDKSDFKNQDSFDKVVTVIKNDKILQDELNKKKDLEIIFSYEDSLDKKEIQTFVSHFNNRYVALKKILQQRVELERASAINRIKGRFDRENIAIIGMVYSKSVTKNGNLIFTLEDPSGVINILVNKSKEELFVLSKLIVLDEVIGITGVISNGIIFAENIFFPDVPSNLDLKTSEEDINFAVLGDIHIGSKHFLYDEFNKMIKWLKGEFGNPIQREDAKKIKYLFIIGDLVDGVGIYPNQQKDLEIEDIYEQYEKMASYLKKIPEHIKIIISSGNHDAVRIPEPQPKLPEDFAKALWALPNVTMVSNPSVVKIGATDNFSGFNVLLYHGFSMPYYAENVEDIRLKGGLENVENIMKFFIKKRHLAPTHASSQYVPDSREDFLVIKDVPDFFITGHIHRAIIANYKKITLINGSSWIGMTDYQEKVGLKPLPSRVPIINLKTRQGKIMRF